MTKRADVPGGEAPVKPGFVRRLAMELAAWILVLVVTLGVLEGALRLGGYGYPTSFFVKQTINGRACYVENTKFGYRFFPPEIARVPSPVVFPTQKAPNTYRVFIFGESAALGDPEPAFGMARFLKALLEQRYPGAAFEVIPAAMTAINSHALLPIARECARLDGDLWIVYMGNNEFVGPFGAGTVFGAKAPPRAVVRAGLALKATRTGQLLDDLLRKWTQKGALPAEWGSLKMFMQSQVALNDPKKERVYHSFEANLDDILRIGQRAGAKVAASSVASNLKDCAPFGSMHGTNLAPAQLAAFEAAMREGAASARATNWNAAISNYLAAAVIDPGFAEARFQLARAYIAVGSDGNALPLCNGARDVDTLAFRADSRINAAIQRTAQGRGIDFVDAVGALQGGGRIPGEELLYEHVHLNFEGNYLVAVLFAEQAARWLPEAIKATGHGTNWATFAQCARWLALTEWDQRRVYEEVGRRIMQPPFINQSNHTNQVAFVRQKLADLRAQMTAARFTEAKAIYEDALKRDGSDFYLRGNYAKLLEDNNDLKGAIAQWDELVKLLPHQPAGFYYRGKLLGQTGDGDAAMASLNRALEIRPDLVEAMNEQSKVLLRAGKPEEALRKLEEIDRLHPNNSRIHLQMAEALARLNRRPEAMRQLERAVELQPANWEARYLLGVELAAQEKIKEARDQFAAVVQLRPEYPLAHLNLGVALAREQRVREAVSEFQQVLKYDPNNARAKEFLQQLGYVILPGANAPTADKAP